MSPLGQTQTSSVLDMMSAVLPITDSTRTSFNVAKGPCVDGSMCGRLQVGKENLHVAGLVGAAMCSAFECGSHDRWP
jgi:hypothetical protein